MGILQRYDATADDLRPSTTKWRYDETSSESDCEDEGEEASQQLDSNKSLPNFQNRNSMLPTIDFCVSIELRPSDSESLTPDRHCGSRVVDLKLSSLASLHALNESSDHSKFAAHGMDPGRIASVLRTPPCPCNCKLPTSVLARACKGFWTLPKASQDALLWSLQSESSASRKMWCIEGLVNVRIWSGLFQFLNLLSSNTSFAGYQLCRLAWTRYLGIGKGRLERCKRSYHGIDDRTINQGSLAAVFDWVFVQNHLIHLDL